jgi:hypothetical protein
MEQRIQLQTDRVLMLLIDLPSSFLRGQLKVLYEPPLVRAAA